MQLIKITTTPMEYKLVLDNAQLTVGENDPAKITPNVTAGRVSMKSENIKVKLDTSAARDSLGFHSQDTFARINGSSGMKAAQAATAQYVQLGNKLAQPNTTVPSVFAQTMVSRPETAMVFLPDKGPDISWEPNKLDISYEPATVKSEYKHAKFSMQYVPAKFQMEITQYPHVQIEYVGGIRYVPASSDPNYNG